MQQTERDRKVMPCAKNYLTTFTTVAFHLIRKKYISTYATVYVACKVK